MPLLEVIACSVADAIAAEAGGADRLEIISHFELGGLTPPIDLVRQVLAAVRIPVRVMLRENAGFGITDAAEMDRLRAAARDLGELPIDGLVLGFLAGNQIDEQVLAELLALAPNLRATFHRAFEELPDPLAAARQLKVFAQIDRILTSGGPAPWEQKVTELAALEKAAAPEISILLGGGVGATAMSLIRGGTGIREFHVGRAARLPQTIAGAVSAESVAEMKRQLAVSS